MTVERYAIRLEGFARWWWWAAGAMILLTAWPSMLGQAAKAPPDGAKNGEDAKTGDAVGSYSLVVASLQASATTHLLTPPVAIAIDGGSAREPGEFSGTKPLPAEVVLEDFGIPRYECTATVPKLHGCDGLDRTDFTIRDANTVGYHIVSHGAAVTLNVNVEVHDLLPVSQAGPNIPWHAREIIFVAVPKATPAYHFSSEVLVGEWNGEAIVFEVGKPLPDSAKKALEDEGVKQDLGDHTLYSFRVKEAAKK